jgi:CRP-like cAMP-binding protein
MSTIEKTFAGGEIIIKEGDIGNSFFQLLEGSAQVYLNYGEVDQVKLTELVPGKYFGEMAVIESYPRSTTVVAGEGAKVIEIEADELKEYFAQYPEKIIDIMMCLGNRLKELTADYDEAKQVLAGMKDPSADKSSFAAAIAKHLNWFKASKKAIDKPSAEALREAAEKVGQDKGDIESYKKGTVIFKQGEVGKYMYILHGGNVGIYTNYGSADQVKLTQLFPVACFGEMGMISDDARSATAVSESDDTYVEVIRAEDLSGLFETCPVKIEMIMRHLSYRLRSLTYDYFNTCKEISDSAGA